MATLNDLMYAYFGGTPSLSDAALAYYQAAADAGVTGTGVIAKGYEGDGTPEGTVTAPVGSVYADTTNGVLYVKNTGTGNTGWVLIEAGAASGVSSFNGRTGAVVPVTADDTDDSTLEVSTNKYRVKDGGITAGKLAADAVETAKILDANVSLAKMANLAESRIIGRAAGAGTGVPTALTPTQTAAIIAGEAITGTSFEATGLTGATENTRLVGATTSGAPVSGTFAVGDVVVDVTGQLWVCTVAGSPGTFVGVGAGRALGYADITASPSGVTAVGVGSRVDLDSGLTITVTVGTRPITLEFWCGAATNNTANDGIGLAIVEGTIGGGAGTVIASANYIVAAGALQSPVVVRRSNLSPSAGSHTYKIMAWAITGGTASIAAAASQRAFIRAIEE